MPVEMFTGPTCGYYRGTKPFASLRQHGQLDLNSKAVCEFGLSDWTAVQLGYDRDEKLIAVCRRDSVSVEYAQRFFVTKTSIARIGVKSFLRFCNIPRPVRAQRYAVTYNSEKEIILVDLKKEL